MTTTTKHLFTALTALTLVVSSSAILTSLSCLHAATWANACKQLQRHTTISHTCSKFLFSRRHDIHIKQASLHAQYLNIRIHRAFAISQGADSAGPSPFPTFGVTSCSTPKSVNALPSGAHRLEHVEHILEHIEGRCCNSNAFTR